ncbi:hypothetical protein E2C01_043389 [Portunus trituberculatus]|uniref:Uncharacterized protein n=1 Tax=Portunus trituberculatus TaxID=210409 RepID=A0A5B7FSU1_PORTR|nr:hypothetical protein [Portunus trituberculatus]
MKNTLGMIQAEILTLLCVQHTRDESDMETENQHNTSSANWRGQHSN